MLFSILRIIIVILIVIRLVLKIKLKNILLILLILFFYDKEIKGYTFSELSDNTKIKVIALALKIDSKIEEYIPGYKKKVYLVTEIKYILMLKID